MPPHVGWRRPLLLIAFISVGVIGNPEGDALNAFRQSLTDSSNVLQSWDPTAPNPCTWFHVTCNAENSVVRLDLQNSGLSGTLVPQLGVLTKLQYLELSRNNILGPISNELGNLSSLVSLDLFQNNLTGTIPDNLGQLSNLQFLRLKNNSLTGSIPVSLTTIAGLQVLDLSYNNLSGEIPNNGSFSFFTPISFLGNNNLCGSLICKQCPQSPYSPSLPCTPPPYFISTKWAAKYEIARKSNCANNIRNPNLDMPSILGCYNDRIGIILQYFMICNNCIMDECIQLLLG